MITVGGDWGGITASTVFDDYSYYVSESPNLVEGGNHQFRQNVIGNFAEI